MNVATTMRLSIKYSYEIYFYFLKSLDFNPREFLFKENICLKNETLKYYMQNTLHNYQSK